VFLFVGETVRLTGFLHQNDLIPYIVVAILDAGRNALSFFMLLVVSLGLSVVRESLGRTMRKCQALAAAHFVFGGMCIWLVSTRLIQNV
jgi:hypothetical protein